MLLTALAIAICPAPPERRITCVVDGDTFWLSGEKFRIAEIDAPEMNGRCEREKRLARRARARLVEIINRRGIAAERIGKDRYGRTLAKTPAISEALIREGLAVRWGARPRWC